MMQLPVGALCAARTLTLLGTACVALTMAGCASSPATRFYTLSGTASENLPEPTVGRDPNANAPTVNRNASMPAPAREAPAASAGSAFIIEVPAVRVPEQVRRPQMVIDVGAGRVALLEQQRWAAPLPAEIRQALSEDLSERLGTIDVYQTPHAASRSLYRIDVNILRFDSAPGRQASIHALWSIDAGAGPVMTCRTTATEHVGDGYDALVQGHRRALGRVADAIAVALRALRAPSTTGPDASSIGPVVPPCPDVGND